MVGRQGDERTRVNGKRDEEGMITVLRADQLTSVDKLRERNESPVPCAL